METVTFTDGMKRIIQTKKEADINGAHGMIVSGKVKFDELGRITEQGQPEPGAFTAAYDSGQRVNVTTFSYDMLDRTTRVVAPDGATTLTFYDFDPSPDGSGTLFLTQVVDPEGHAKESYKDVNDRIHAVVEHNTIDGSAVNIVTTYQYDVLGQITRVATPRATPRPSPMTDWAGGSASTTPIRV